MKSLDPAFLLAVTPMIAAEHVQPVRIELPGQTFKAGAGFDVVLINDSDGPIYLNWTFPGSVPLPERRSEVSGAWDRGKGPIQCGTVQRPDSPRELPAGARATMPVYWDSTLSEIDGEQAFLTEADEYLKLHGIFRVTVSYSLEPWSSGHRPSTVLRAVSEPFEVTP